MLEVTFITLPIFLLVVVGYVLRFASVVDREGVSLLNSVVYWTALPALILVSFWQVNWFDIETLRVLGINLLLISIFALILFTTLSLLPLSQTLRSAIFTGALVGNTVYMGFPIAHSALGDASFHLYVASATPHLVFGILLSILAIEYWVVRAGRFQKYLYEIFFNPLTLAIVLGALLSVLDVSGELVEVLRTTLLLLGAVASPLALMVLGAFLYGAFRPEYLKIALWMSGIKLILFPLFVLLFGIVFGLGSTVVLASVLASAMPSAVTAFVIAEKYSIDPGVVANALLVSTVCGIVTISGILFIL